MGCWVLAEDACVVALKHPSALYKKQQMGHGMATTLMAICLMLAVLAVLLTSYWYISDHGIAGIVPPRGYDCSVPLCDPDVEPDIPNAAAAGLLGDRVERLVERAVASSVEPCASGESSLRISRGGSRRSIEVAGADGAPSVVPRNIATGFLAGR